MSKELIVSLNGREKKIAIVENGKVTEFYIERGESSQGIVGNIYKGRVMRVLPGMQSAFVDIGLERDAFLYVSDFFDEEEEFERIVIDKTKTGEAADAAEAARVAAERIERSRIERERQMEKAHETAQPDPATEYGAAADEDEAEFMTSLAEATGEAPSAARADTDQSARAAEETEDGGRKRGRRGRRPERGGSDRAPETRAGDGGATREREQTSPRGQRDTRRQAVEDINTPFVAGDASFERVVDEGEAAADEGEMFKDARLQERILDQIHAIEFDMEGTAEAEVGSLLSTGASANSNFQRIADDDDAEQAAPRRPSKSVQQSVATSIARIADEVEEESTPLASGRAQSFERISDDETGGEASAASTGTTEAAAGAGTPAKRTRTRRSKTTAEAAPDDATRRDRNRRRSVGGRGSQKEARGVQGGERRVQEKGVHHCQNRHGICFQRTHAAQQDDRHRDDRRRIGGRRRRGRCRQRQRGRQRCGSEPLSLALARRVCAARRKATATQDDR